MILSKHAILSAFKSGKWKCNKDIDSLNLGPNSIDVSLTEFMLIPNSEMDGALIDPKSCSEWITDSMYSRIKMPDHKNYWDLGPKEFCLGSVNEKFDCSEPLVVDGKLKYYVPMYEGRSTMARLGIQSHISAGFGDYGFDGSFTLELVNNAPWTVRLHKDMRIGQVYFIEVDDGVLLSPKYKGYDQGECLPERPRLGLGRF